MGEDTIKHKPAINDLRSRAERQLNTLEPDAGCPRNDDQTQRLLHELQVHRIELEMQNAELCNARDLMERSLEKYSDLYNSAPVGYFTLDRTAGITTANRSGAALLGVDASRLVGRRFVQWIVEEYRSTFLTFFDTVCNNHGKVVCEFAVMPEGEELPRFVQAEAMNNSAGQECLIALIDITERKQAEEELRCYARRLIEMEENLRKQLATELHDEIGRDLTVIGMNLAIIRNSLTLPSPENLVERLQDSSKLVEGISRTVRGIMVMLRPPVLDDYGLFAALRWHADLFTKRTGITVFVQADDPPPRLMIEKELALFRIAQEALINVSKHAGTTEVTIIITCSNGMLRMLVSDAGKGCTPASFEHIQASPGWGMKIMRERAELIGGKFQVDSAPGRGTRVSVEVPLEEC